MDHSLRSRLLWPLLVCGLPLMAQAPAKPAPQAPAKAASQAAPSGNAPTAATPADPAINPEDLISVHTTPYHPTMIRDPFAAPTDAEQSHQGDLVDDIAVKGRVFARGKALAIVSDSRGNIRTLGVGFKFRDGELVAVNEKSVTFHQWDVGSTNTRVYRTVVKTFKREEGKR